MPTPKKPANGRAKKAAPKKVDRDNEADVKNAIDRLTKRLRAERQENRGYRALIAKNKAQIQTLEAWRRTRKRQLAKIKNRGARATVDAALRSVGVTENPPGSNRGPGIIDRCQMDIIGYAGVAWCGCFAGYHARRFGGVSGVSSRVAYCPYIDEDAQAHRNGFVGKVPLTEGQPGDFCVFDWEHDGREDHVGIIVENLGNGLYRTVEGNTSFDNNGSQANGGAVALRTRSSSLFGLIARPAYL